MPSKDDIPALPSVRRVRPGHRAVAAPDGGKMAPESADSNPIAYLRQVRRLRQQYAGDPARLQHYLGELSRGRDKVHPRTAAGTMVRPQSTFAPGAVVPLAKDRRSNLRPSLIADGPSPRSSTENRYESAGRGAPRQRFSRAVVDWFSDHVADQLDDRLLHFSKRQALLKTADRLGIGRFHANLIIAVAQHQAGEVKIPDLKLYPVRSRSTKVMATVAIVLIVQTLIVAGAWFMLHS